MAALLAVGAWRLGRAPSAADALPSGGLGRLEVAAALAAPDARGFARALAPRPFVFPADHGSHPEYRTEWWYFTGNLAARDGRRFGFQLTFFRSALAPAASPLASRRASAWATRQVWFAHFAVTDAAGRRFVACERWERQALGLAGAQASPFHVWVGPWTAVAAGPDVAGTPPMRLTAFSGGAACSDRGGAPAGAAGEAAAGVAAGEPAGEAAIDLLLTAELPPVPQGDHGLSSKSGEPGNASYYYSLPRLAAAGTLRLRGERLAVSGSAWMDREWSTSSLAAGEVGWDWFALQLDDGWELMLYRLRRRPPAVAAAGGAAAGVPPRATAAAAAADLADPASLVTLIAPDGGTERFPLAALRFAATATWTSPASHVRYPAGWRLTLPAAGLAAFDLGVQPLLDDQELRLSFRYWEGAVTARGIHGGRPVTARGYVELTGYGEAGARPPGSGLMASPAPGASAERAQPLH
ncbi:MAG: carotenoid 1,2-hydratase [Acidobacteria bacterium]|nr:carotenoid 1,2-hydratase [Acidobacteriota bacterium]